MSTATPSTPDTLRASRSQTTNGSKAGTLTSRPLILPGPRLFLNVDAAGGNIRALVLGPSGKVLASSKPTTGDQRRIEVHWERGRLADCKGQAVTFRFVLRNARFFAYWFGA